MEIGQLAFVDLLNHAFLAHFVDKVGGRNHQIVRAFFVGLQFRVHGFVRLVGRIDNLNPGFFGELFQQAGRHILGPVIEIDGFTVVRMGGAHSQC